MVDLLGGQLFYAIRCLRNQLECLRNQLYCANSLKINGFFNFYLRLKGSICLKGQYD